MEMYACQDMNDLLEDYTECSDNCDLSSTFLNKKTFTIPVQIADIIIITLPQRNASCKELLNITYVKYMNNGNNI